MVTPEVVASKMNGVTDIVVGKSEHDAVLEVSHVRATHTNRDDLPHVDRVGFG